MMSIATLTMNPAIEIASRTERLPPTDKMRCETPRFDPGEGGINVAPTVVALGYSATAVFPAPTNPHTGVEKPSIGEVVHGPQSAAPRAPQSGQRIERADPVRPLHVRIPHMQQRDRARRAAATTTGSPELPGSSGPRRCGGSSMTPWLRRWAKPSQADREIKLSVSPDITETTLTDLAATGRLTRPAHHGIARHAKEFVESLEGPCPKGCRLLIRLVASVRLFSRPCSRRRSAGRCR
ncbi:hypothetical protein AWN90_22190 [Nocardia terpenica]|uniref:Carbohydrate kinase PfkB domain-containing protein n=1 Tax=Nocardia terpenica TaxID=455432 RepID=A0A164NUZ0_9NOCA|nr:hypothetical protein AWN90_22190 [Nocardia terpenica]